MEHLSQEQLDALVMGVACRNHEAVRRHLATCGACARQLVREAQLESDLYDAAATVAKDVVMAQPRPAPARTWWVALPVAAALAAVAFGAWSLIWREEPEVARHRASTVGVPPANTPGFASPSNPGPRAHELPPQDVCRCVTVERGEGPPTDPGGSLLCTPPSTP